MTRKIANPQIRFSGFTDPWEQRKLCELGEFKSNGVDKLSKPDEYPVNLLNYMDVYNRRNITAINCNELMHVTAKSQQIKENNVVENDVFFTPTSETADDIGHVMVIEETLENTVYSYHLMRFRPFVGKLYKTFPNYGFATNCVRTQMSLLAQGVQRFVLSKGQFESINVAIPKFDEQKKIADFFTSLDSLITLHQRKYDKLTNVKKSMLEKMFPKNGSNVPEIRFKGFSDAWEQRKLGEVCSEIGDGLHSAPIYDENGKYYFINGNNLVHGTIQIDDMVTKKVSSEIFEQNDKHLDETTVLLSINGTIGNLAYYQGEKVMLGKSAAYLKAKNVDKSFLFTSLQTSTIMNTFMLSLTGTTIKNLGLEAIKKISIQVPEKDEQIKIGCYFSNLDHLITLHQRKLIKLKQIKSALLDKMFAKQED